MSPTVFRKDGYRFFFFSREEAQKHVHIYSGEGEVKFWLEPQVEMSRNHGLSPAQLKKIELIIEEHLDELKTAWDSHFSS